jgi:hypothetical protein
MGHGAMAAHQTLNLWILVRIQVPQPYTHQIGLCSQDFAKAWFLYITNQCKTLSEVMYDG